MVAQYRKASHTVYSVVVHIVWVTKYRYKVLNHDIGLRTKALIQRTCSELDIDIQKGSIAQDHVHLLLSIPPQLAISNIVQQLKGITSRKLQQEFPELRKRYWGQHFWARGYFVVSTGNVTTEMIKNYIEHHFEEPDQGENFRVET